MFADAPLSRRFRAQVKVQWKRILWDLRGDSLTKYRQKIQSHTDSIILLLSTFIWSATDRIEEDVKRHAQRLDELLYQAPQFNRHQD
ncbi:hypothetical protein ETB97_006616 [Aspergillus alliaceus]|uniref:Uncharacterized protein n=1 Tax=Petromyces alliaceus TaxID=209559 RepID=A0A8H6AD06_PETAA|nr:hypothetical protein ETB97_006616 [Aspergillus burnettii]